MENGKKILNISYMEFADFLSRSKREGYASGRKYDLDDMGRKVFFNHGVVNGNLILTYQDSYSGSLKAPGTETVSVRLPSELSIGDKNSRIPIWVMSYGFHPEDGFQAMALENPFLFEESIAFLRKALSHPDEKNPIRGPGEFSDGRWLYDFVPSGDLRAFQGKEYVSVYDRRNKNPENRGIVFKQNIVGGLVQHKELEVRLVE